VVEVVAGLLSGSLALLSAARLATDVVNGLPAWAGTCSSRPSAAPSDPPHVQGAQVAHVAAVGFAVNLVAFIGRHARLTRRDRGRVDPGRHRVAVC
jgi:Co/Zn/Cd efflux system component